MLAKTSFFPTIRKSGAVVLTSLLIALSSNSCTTISGVESTTVYKSKDGVAVVDTFQTAANVTAINPKIRKLGLLLSGGKRTTVKCGPEVVNFDQIKVGDRIDLIMGEEFAIYLGHGKAPSARGNVTVALAKVGAKPGAATIETIEATARIKSIDAPKHKVTFERPDGSLRTLKTGDRFDLSRFKVGDNVTIEYTEAYAIRVSTPKTSS